MNNADAIDQINQIKGKLTKYSEKKINTDKVNEYLTLLSSYTVNAEILKQTDIYKYLKELKKKENPAFSQNAGNLCLKWKKQLVNSEQKNSNESNCKYEPTPINNSSKTQSQSDKYNNNPTKKPKKSYIDATKNTKENSEFLQRHNDETCSAKKRPPEVKSSNQSVKKPKLSLNDYKKKKPLDNHAEFDMFESNHNEDSPDSNQNDKQTTSNGSCKYGFDDLSDDDSNGYSPTPIESLEKKSSHKSSNLNKSNSKDLKKQSSKSLSSNKNMIVPPKPSASLEDILGTESKSLPEKALENPSRGHSTSMNRLATSSTLSRSMSNNMESVDEALTRIMRQKQSKRMIYTGKSRVENSGQAIPSLYNLCSRTLVDSLDTLPNKISIYNMTHDFAIAFDLLKPVLEKANAKQLENIENYSPHLLNDTDYIWQRICEQEFKKIDSPDEDESWREHYFKKYDAREQQFLRARSIVSRMQKDKPQERVTKMATLKPAVRNLSQFPRAYNGPKSINGSTNKPLGPSSGSKTSTGYIKSAPKVIVKEPKQIIGFARAPPVMSRGMRDTMKMLKTRRK